MSQTTPTALPTDRRPRARRFCRRVRLERRVRAAAGRRRAGEAPANPLRGISIDSAYVASVLDRFPARCWPSDTPTAGR